VKLDYGRIVAVETPPHQKAGTA